SFDTAEDNMSHLAGASWEDIEEVEAKWMGTGGGTNKGLGGQGSGQRGMRQRNSSSSLTRPASPPSTPLFRTTSENSIVFLDHSLSFPDNTMTPSPPSSPTFPHDHHFGHEKRSNSNPMKVNRRSAESKEKKGSQLRTRQRAAKHKDLNAALSTSPVKESGVSFPPDNFPRALSLESYQSQSSTDSLKTSPPRGGSEGPFTPRMQNLNGMNSPPPTFGLGHSSDSMIGFSSLSSSEGIGERQISTLSGNSREVRTQGGKGRTIGQAFEECRNPNKKRSGFNMPTT
ncbi:hypothetical protein TrRE_jg504, partial [Triparma retinervis]